MKNLLTVTLVAAVAATLASCGKEGNIPVKKPSSQHTYTFILEAPGVRAILNDAGDAYTWETGDNVGVYVSASGADKNTRCSVAKGTPSTISLTTSVALAGGDKVYAYYPYSAANDAAEAGSVVLGIPVKQDGSLKDAMPMAALPVSIAAPVDSDESVVGTLTMVNLASIVEFKIYGGQADENIVSVKFAKNGIAGSFDPLNLDNVAKVDGKASGVALAGGTASEVVVELPEPVAVGADKAGATSVYAVIAPGDYSGSVVTVITDKRTCTATVSGASISVNTLAPFFINLGSQSMSTYPAGELGVKYLDKTKKTDQIKNVWTVEDASNPDSFDAWSWYYYTSGKIYFAKVSGFESSASRHTLDTYLVSPIFDLSGLATATVDFVQTGKYFPANGQENYISLLIREAGTTAWTELDIPAHDNNYGVKAVSLDISNAVSAFACKSVQFAFRYRSDGTENGTGTWQLYDFVVDGIEPPQPGVTTGGASGVTVESATLSATYSELPSVPQYVGFEWGTSEDQMNQDLKSQSTVSGTSGTFTATMEYLTSATTYYYRAYACYLGENGYVYVYGEVESFGTPTPGSEGQGLSPEQAGWFELPSMNYNVSGGYMVDKNDPNLYYAYHKADVGTRNYTVCYNGEYHCPVWVAAPRHPIYSTNNVKRSNAYAKDPNIPSGVQQASTSGSTSGYNRGHMLGSAERLGSSTLNRQVFYISNIAPQNSTWFNTGGGGWNILEAFVDGFECTDTLYVVIGTYFEDFTDGYGNSATKKTAQFMGSTVQIPTAFYYAMMRTKRGNSGKSLKNCDRSEIQCAAFVRAHAQGTKGQKVTKTEMMTIDQLEQLTGFDYFPGVANAPEDSFTASDWGL